MSKQRVQLALNVANIDEAVAYYTKLFGVEAAKRKPGYANFAINEPPLKLVPFENPNAAERINHLGVEVFDQADVAAATDRFVKAGIADKEEVASTCCYATQTKVWSQEPQGLRWEWYVVHDDAETFFGTPAPSEPQAACCG